MAWSRIFFFWMAFVFTTLATASSAPSVGTFEKRAWTPIDGAPSGAWKIAQTDDGLLWFASSSGLYRFDGEKFHRVDQVYGSDTPRRSLGEVAALKRGLVLIYQFGGLSIFTHDGVTHYDSKDGLPGGSLRSVTETEDGEIYVGTPKGVAKLNGKSWEVLRDIGLPEGGVDKILLDQSGTIWVSIEGMLYARPRSGKVFSPYTGGGLAKWTVPELILGKVLVISADRKVVQVEFGKEPVSLFDKLSSDIDSVFEGPLSSMLAWLGDRGGLVRLQRKDGGGYAIAESLEAGRMANSAVLVSMVDREGNVWISTLNGVERLRAQRIHDISMPGTVFLPYIHKGLDDAILMSGVASTQVLTVTDAGNVNPMNLPNVAAMWRENAGSLWAGSAAYLYHITRGGVTKWPLPVKLFKWQTVQGIAVDRDGIVWVSIVRHGLYRFSNGRWTPVDTSVVGKDPNPIILYVGESGRVRLGFTDGRIAEIIDGTVHPLATTASLGIGTILSLIEIDGHLIAGGENGLIWVDQDRNKALLPEQIKVFRGVAGLGLDGRGDLWVHGTDGVYRIARDELVKFWEHPNRQLKWEILSLADGVRGNAAQIRPLPSLTVANDGRIYYATNSQVGWFDPMNLHRNTRVPDVMVLGLHTRTGVWEPKGPIYLDAGTTALEIEYAVTALSVPEKVKVKYRLNGVDHEWQEPTGERVARYTNLEPGNYTFQVIGANEDGVWNNDGATLTFEILPEFWQATWFRLLILALLLGIIVALYRWRMAMVAERSVQRAAARIEERVRIARNLHDNLLQGVHALILRSSAILHRLPRGSHEQRILEDVLEQAEQLVADTRDEVMALRESQTAEQFVAELCKEIDALKPTVNGQLKLTVSTGVDRLRPGVARELCQVIKEGVLNAVHHSSALEIKARLTVTPDGVEGSVLDNGIGIQPEVAQNGSPGHWGIVGMHERVSKLGGTLTIGSNGDTGTALRVVLPSAAAFN